MKKMIFLLYFLSIFLFLTINSAAATIYELPINISSTGSALANYQVKVTITNTIVLGHTASDGRDIRFFNQQTTNPYNTTTGMLNLWIESISPSQLVVWVKVDSIPASGGKTIYMYYGDASATSQSSFSATMVVLSSNPSFATYGSWSPSTYNTQTNPGNTLVPDGSYGYMYTGDAWIAQDEGCYWIWNFGSSASRSFYIKWYDSATKVSSYCMSFTTYVYVSPDGSSWTLIASNTLSGTGTSQVFTSNYNGSYRYARVQQYSTKSCMVYGYTYVDGVWARSYSSPEPTASAGAETLAANYTIKIYINTQPSDVGQSLVKTCDCGVNSTCDCTFTYNPVGTTYGKAETWLGTTFLSSSGWILIYTETPYFSDFTYSGHINYFNIFWNVTYSSQVNVSCIFDCDPRIQNCDGAQKCTPYPVTQSPGRGGCTVLNPIYSYTRKTKLACQIVDTFNPSMARWYPENPE